ncbi:MAG: VCBS repeat-containing protein [Planctomycetota bacterium]
MKIFLLMLLCSLLVGCGSANPTESNGSERDSDPVLSPPSYRELRDKVRQAVAQNQLKRAAELVKSAMIQFPNDAGLLADAAAIQARLGEKELATELLMRACEMSQFRDGEILNAATAALKEWGRLYRLSDAFDSAMEANPDQWNWKWSQTELLYGLELRERALAASFELVRARQFRLVLLERMAWNRERVLETSALIEAHQRNPDEPRILLGVLRQQVEQAEFAEAKKTERLIAAKHPRDPILAYWSGQRILLDQEMTDSERYDAAAKWFRDRLPESEGHYGLALLAMAQLSAFLGDERLATDLYRSAAIQLPNHASCWAEYARRVSMDEVSSELSNAIIRRARLLNHLDQLLDQWRARQRRDLGTGIKIVKVLDQVGRLWEAEAWCAAMSAEFQNTPQSESSDYESIAALRRKIIGRMKPDTDVVELGRVFDELTDSKAILSVGVEKSLKQLLASIDSELPVAISATNNRRERSDPAPTFRHVSVEAGLNFHGRTADDLDTRGIPLFQTLGCGGGTIDFDRDGLDDLVFADAGGVPLRGNHRTNRIFRNVGGVFVDVTQPARYEDDEFGQGIAIGDVNGDGLDDIFNTNFGENRLLINQGDGSFRELPFFGNDDSWSTSAGISDLNLDGHADIVYLNYCEGSTLTAELCADDKQIIAPPSDGNEPAHHACSPMQYSGSRNVWIPGTIEFHLEAQDLQVDGGLQEDSDGRSLGISIFRDSPKLQASATPVQFLITNDMSANELWLGGTKNGIPQQQPANLLGLANGIQGRPEGSMGVASLDINQDGRVDFLVTNFEDEYNSLYLSREVGYSIPPTSSALSAFKSVGFGVVSEDFAESGQYTWVITNGHVDDFADIREGSKLFQPMQMFRFSPNGTSSLVRAKESGTRQYLSASHCGRALWTADIDDDMRLDLIVTHQDKPVAVLRNETPASEGRAFAEIELVGVQSDRNAIGTWVSNESATHAASWSLQVDSYLSTNVRRVRLSWDSSSALTSLTVDWPSGHRQTIDTSVWTAQSPVSCIIVEGQSAFILDEFD